MQINLYKSSCIEKHAKQTLTLEEKKTKKQQFCNA